VEEVILADELGFESAWLAESVFYPARPMSNPLMVAIAAAQKAPRIRFGTLATQVPLHHPFDTATQSATCDILTNGRLDLCIGGRWGSPAGIAFGQNSQTASEESRERVAESIDLIRKCWTQERVNFSGKYWTVKDMPVLPTPMQKPHPPLFVAANSDSTFPYAASQGLGVIGTTLSQPMPRLIDRLKEFEDSKQPDKALHPQKAHVALSFFVGKTRKEAHDVMRNNWRDSDIISAPADASASTVGTSRHNFTTGVGGWATWNFDEAVQNSIYDDPAGCVEKLQALQEQLPTMDTCILEFNRRGRTTSERVKESMRLFADKVMPKLV
jgi:alkanesulfonate monooxygenase SsuD/methylene tetrahydromethanopterin reductase-like flavin-dependent oxidoreductase (luciferase family)